MDYYGNPVCMLLNRVWLVKSIIAFVIDIKLNMFGDMD